MRSIRRALIGGALVAALAIVGGVAPAQAAPPTPTVAFSLSIGYSANLRVLSTGRFHGVVTHVPTSTPVQVQRRTTTGVWRTVVTTRTGSGGRFAGTFTPTGLGATAFRARTPGAGSRAAADSPSRTVTVSEFFFLDTIPLAHPVDGITFGPVTNADGNVFPHALVMDGAVGKGHAVLATWTIGGHCSKVFTFLGLPPAEDGLVAVASVGSGKDLVSANTVDGDGFNVIQTPITGVTQLTLATSIDKPGTGGQKVDWFYASVLCTVDPRSL